MNKARVAEAARGIIQFENRSLTFTSKGKIPNLFGGLDVSRYCILNPDVEVGAPTHVVWSWACNGRWLNVLKVIWHKGKDPKVKPGSRSAKAGSLPGKKNETKQRTGIRQPADKKTSYESVVFFVYGIILPCSQLLKKELEYCVEGQVSIMLLL